MPPVSRIQTFCPECKDFSELSTIPMELIQPGESSPEDGRWQVICARDHLLLVYRLKDSECCACGHRKHLHVKTGNSWDPKLPEGFPCSVGAAEIEGEKPCRCRDFNGSPWVELIEAMTRVENANA